VNQEGEGNNVGLDAMIYTRPSPTMKVTLLPPPSPRGKDVPLPHLSVEDVLLPPPPEMNETLMNLVNLLQQQNNKLEFVEKNEEKIPTEIATHIEVAQHNKCNETSVGVDNATFIPANHHKGGGNPLENSCKGDRSYSTQAAMEGKALPHT
jgi:hypothetical protein